MSKTKQFDTLYAVRDKETKKVERNIKCKGGTYYAQKPLCQKRCDGLNSAIKNFANNNHSEYEVGEYAVVDIEKYKELLGDS